MVAALLWLVAGLLLAGSEVLAGDFVLLMLGGGALVTAGVAAVAGDAYVAQAAVFAAVSAALVAGVRPALKRRALHGSGLRTGVSALVGEEAVVLVHTDSRSGQVKLSGEVWSARASTVGEELEPGRTVRVVEIDGATAVVWGES